MKRTETKEYIAQKEAFSKNFREMRKNRGLSQAEAAELLGLSASTISYYESMRRLPTYSGLRKITEVFGVSEKYLMGDGEYSTDSYAAIIETAQAKGVSVADMDAALTLVVAMKKSEVLSKSEIEAINTFLSQVKGM